MFWCTPTIKFYENKITKCELKIVISIASDLNKPHPTTGCPKLTKALLLSARQLTTNLPLPVACLDFKTFRILRT